MEEFNEKRHNTFQLFIDKVCADIKEQYGFKDNTEIDLFMIEFVNRIDGYNKTDFYKLDDKTQINMVPESTRKLMPTMTDQNYSRKPDSNIYFEIYSPDRDFTFYGMEKHESNRDVFYGAVWDKQEKGFVWSEFDLKKLQTSIQNDRAGEKFRISDGYSPITYKTLIERMGIVGRDHLNEKEQVDERANYAEIMRHKNKGKPTHYKPGILQEIKRGNRGNER